MESHVMHIQFAQVGDGAEFKGCLVHSEQRVSYGSNSIVYHRFFCVETDNAGEAAQQVMDNLDSYYSSFTGRAPSKVENCYRMTVYPPPNPQLEAETKPFLDAYNKARLEGKKNPAKVALRRVDKSKKRSRKSAE